LHHDEKELWLSVQPGQDIDYIDFDELSDNVDRFVAMLFDQASDTDPPGPLCSRAWFEGWLHVLLEDSDTKQWIVALGSYGYDWTEGAKTAESISFPEAKSDPFQSADRITIPHSIMRIRAKRTPFGS
jgi:hypothetical protein